MEQLEVVKWTATAVMGVCVLLYLVALLGRAFRFDERLAGVVKAEPLPPKETPIQRVQRVQKEMEAALQQSREARDELYQGEALAAAEVRRARHGNLASGPAKDTEESEMTPKEVEAASKDRQRESVLRRQQEGEAFARFLEQCRRTEEALERVKERKEQQVKDFEQSKENPAAFAGPKSPTPAPKAGVTVEASIKPTDDQKRRHESYWRIKQACLATSVSVPREIEEYFATAPDAEQLKEIPCVIDPVVLAEKDGISIRFAAQAVAGAGVVKILVRNVLVFEGPAKPFEQPHDGQRRLGSGSLCNCTRCCKFRNASCDLYRLTQEDYQP